MLMKLVYLSQNSSKVNFSRFSTFSDFGTSYGEPIWLDVIILDYIVLFKSQIFKDKNQNSIEIWTALTICWFLPIITFDTI